ncbi:sirohydrochlorin chelatase [Oceanospirillum maris]|uniref:sirohydrochlorin chelatase n=1 Tax=Oceanospirillum maris TaxID=64977 RepID=UPI0004004647|nr:sirohydrochlorin chelatase [Oceanospirillum maris]
MAKQGIMVCGHGSRDKDAEREFGRVAEGLKKRFPDLPVEYGFLEFSAPNIHMGLNALVDQGVEEIYAVPGMLFAATHAKNDIPSVLTTFQDSQRGLTVKYGSELGLHDAMISAFQTRIYESLGLDANNPPDNLYDTLLVVVGRGTSDTHANAEAAKLTRIVNENMGFGWADTVYSGVTYPSVGVGLEKLLKLGYKRVVIAPYFLFTGRLIKRIYGYVDKVAAENPEIEFIKAQYLNDHEKVIDAFEVRVREIMQQDEAGPESLMSAFKRRLASGEVDIHHHHAEFQPHKHSHDHGHHHSHDHSHSHSHGVYRHIGHPLGPRTMIGENICCCFMGQFPQSILDEEQERIALNCPENALAHR